MKLTEVFNTKLPLTWKHDVNEFYSEFLLGENSYGISAIDEDIDDTKTLRVDFHLKVDGKVSHSATNFGNDSFKVLSIVSNGIKEKFLAYDIIYFLAKKTELDKEFNSRVKLYSRIIDKLGVENNRIKIKKELQNEYVFALCKTEKDKEVFLNFL